MTKSNILPFKDPLHDDLQAVLTSLDTSSYHWDLVSDKLAWGKNIAKIKELAALSQFKTGSQFSKAIAGETNSDRATLILSSKAKDLGEGVPFQTITTLILSDSLQITLKDHGRWFANAQGEPIYARGLVQWLEQPVKPQMLEEDFSEKQQEQHLIATLTNAIKHAKQTRSSVAFMLISVDNLARINDAYGYEVADELLKNILKRMERMLRGGDILGRFSGNKIGVVMHRCNQAEMKIAAERFIEAVEDKNFITSIGDIASTITIGGAVVPDHAHNLTDILAHTQEALTQAKATKRGTFEVYTPSEQRDTLRRENARITEDVIQALNARQMALAFQPIVQAKTPRDTVYYEVLLRLKRNDGTTIGTPAVMALAEKLGLVRLIDKQILDLSVKDMAQSPSLKLSINVTPASTIDDDWINNLKSHIQDVPNIMERMVVEITETSAILDISETKRFVRQIKDLGGKVAIDDFGAGYTSFKNLRSLGVDIVKLDGSFIENFEQSSDDRHFVETLLSLANHIGLTTVAEWVQSEKTAIRLAELGCHYLQGYYTGAASEKKPWLLRP